MNTKVLLISSFNFCFLFSSVAFYNPEYRVNYGTGTIGNSSNEVSCSITTYQRDKDDRLSPIKVVEATVNGSDVTPLYASGTYHPSYPLRPDCKKNNDSVSGKGNLYGEWSEFSFSTEMPSLKIICYDYDSVSASDIPNRYESAWIRDSKGGMSYFEHTFVSPSKPSLEKSYPSFTCGNFTKSKVLR